MANNDDKQDSQKVSEPAYASRSSRIITMAKTNPFLPLSLFLVIGSVFIPFEIYRVIYLFLASVLVCILLHCYRPRMFPLWFRHVADYYILQLQEKPVESIGLIIIFGGSMLNRIIWPSIESFTVYREGISCILLLLSFGLYGHKPAGRRRSIWELFRKRKRRKPAVKLSEEEKVKTVPPGEEREDAPDNQTGAQHDAWHKKQEERWNNWIQEEVDRLDGDKKK